MMNALTQISDAFAQVEGSAVGIRSILTSMELQLSDLSDQEALQKYPPGASVDFIATSHRLRNELDALGQVLDDFSQSLRGRIGRIP